MTNSNFDKKPSGASGNLSAAHPLSDAALAKLREPMFPHQQPAAIKPVGVTHAGTGAVKPQPQPHPDTLSPQRIAELKAAGYTVENWFDTDPPAYIWRGKEGQNARRDSTQPLRKSAAQAWYDCHRYDSLDTVFAPQPDWMDANPS